MKHCFLIIALTAFGCNSNQENVTWKEAESKDDKCFIYPSGIDSLQATDLYDSARWYVYTWNCDILYNPKSDSLKHSSFGELELKFNNLLVKHDTLELSFNFMDKQEAILPSMMEPYQILVTGVGFNIKTRSKIYMTSRNGFSESIKGGVNRYESPLTPEVLAYLKKNWNKLDKCFKELAERKGVSK